MTDFHLNFLPSSLIESILEKINFEDSLKFLQVNQSLRGYLLNHGPFYRKALNCFRLQADTRQRLEIVLSRRSFGSSFVLRLKDEDDQVMMINELKTYFQAERPDLPLYKSHFSPSIQSQLFKRLRSPQSLQVVFYREKLDEQTLSLINVLLPEWSSIDEFDGLSLRPDLYNRCSKINSPKVTGEWHVHCTQINQLNLRILNNQLIHCQTVHIHRAANGNVGDFCEYLVPNLSLVGTYIECLPQRLQSLLSTLISMVNDFDNCNFLVEAKDEHFLCNFKVFKNTADFLSTTLNLTEISMNTDKNHCLELMTQCLMFGQNFPAYPYERNQNESLRCKVKFYQNSNRVLFCLICWPFISYESLQFYAIQSKQASIGMNFLKNDHSKDSFVLRVPNIKSKSDVLSYRIIS